MQPPKAFFNAFKDVRNKLDKMDSSLIDQLSGGLKQQTDLKKKSIDRGNF